MSSLNVARLLLVVVVVVAGISAWALVEAINEGDAVYAWIWATMFSMASLLAAWYLMRLV